MHPKGKVVYKGVNPNIDSYSAFFDNAKLGKTCLEELIRNEGCTDVFVCGIATDVCVGKLFIDFDSDLQRFFSFSLNCSSC